MHQQIIAQLISKPDIFHGHFKLPIAEFALIRISVCHLILCTQGTFFYDIQFKMLAYILILKTNHPKIKHFVDAKFVG